MNMDEWMILVLAVIAVTACIKTGVLISRNRNMRTTSANAGNQAVTLPESIGESITETGPMVYYANDNHGRRDKEYRFNYKKVNGFWRAYILQMPSLEGRASDGHTTHRLWDGSRPYVCWDTPVGSLGDIQAISRVWADCIQEYIATGKRFG